MGKIITVMVLKLKEIEQAIEQNNHWIGKQVKGGTIDEIVPVPVVYAQKFWEYYTQFLDGQQAFAALIHEVGELSTGADYQLEVVCDKDKIRTGNALFHISLDELNQ